MKKTEIYVVLVLACLSVKAQSSKETQESENCTCIPISQCGFITPLVTSLRQIDKCENRLYICCADENIIPVIPPNPPVSTCGQRNPHGIHFELLTADIESQYAEFPWMIEISAANDQSVYHYISGGSLISPTTVLTAAHKIQDINLEQLRVRAGEWERNSINEPYPHQDRNVSRIVIHPLYNVGFLKNGIAILILESPIDLAGHINTICLPPTNFNFTGRQCFVSGWGADARENNNALRKPVDILKKIEVPIVADHVCQDQMRRTRLGRQFKLHASFMCAGGEKDKDACVGDGGSPLVCPIPNSVERYYLAGIVVGGVGCGQEEVPGIYIAVSKFISWINAQISN